MVQGGIHKVLQKLGFKLYDELFDYSFDNEMHRKTRAGKIVKEIRNNITTSQSMQKCTSPQNGN